ncbi:Tryptophan aminotransferase-related protein 4 [Linum grandiflorum]
MGKPNDHQTLISPKISVGLLVLCLSILLNFSLLGYNFYFIGGGGRLSWSRRAAEEAELVAAISCSGHGRAYLDGEISGGDGGLLPGCECNTCYGGNDCSQFDPSCSADADGGNPLFLEPFWIQRAAASAVVIAGHHRMGYTYGDSSFTSSELERHIRQLHSIVGNAITENKSIIFGAGSTQLLNAAVHALSSSSSSAATGVVASPPFYPVYELQTQFFDSKDFQFQGDASTLLHNKSSSGNPVPRIIEFVTSPNNPDGKLNRAVLQGRPNSKAIYDRAYYWPHFTPIPPPAADDDDPDVVIFTLSKLTGHAGSRFGWAIVKDEEVYGDMMKYLQLNTMGDSRESQLRALMLLKTVIGGGVSVSGGDGSSSIFDFAHETMKKRWQRLRSVVETSKRFSLQEVSSQYCRFFGKEREASPAYAWLKCEGQEDIGSSCYEVLKRGGLLGREGTKFSASDRYVRLSLIKTEDDFDLLIKKLNNLIISESQPKDGINVFNDVIGGRSQAFPRRI